jgi:hypothetical protein
MVFTSKYKVEPIAHLKLEGKLTAFSYSVKYLGGLLEPKLKWKLHITDRRKKFYSSMWESGN